MSQWNVARDQPMQQPMSEFLQTCPNIFLSISRIRARESLHLCAKSHSLSIRYLNIDHSQKPMTVIQYELPPYSYWSKVMDFRSNHNRKPSAPVPLASQLSYNIKSWCPWSRKLQLGTVIWTRWPSFGWRRGPTRDILILEMITCSHIFGNSASVALQWRWLEESIIMLMFL